VFVLIIIAFYQLPSHQLCQVAVLIGLAVNWQGMLAFHQETIF